MANNAIWYGISYIVSKYYWKNKGPEDQIPYSICIIENKFEEMHVLVISRKNFEHNEKYSASHQY